MKNLQTQLKKALEQRNSAEKAKQHLTQLRQRLKAEYQRYEKLAKRLEEEDKDYEQLQKLSLRGLFYAALGNKEQQMEKEKQQYLEASLQFDESRKAIELMEFEQGVLEEKLSKLAGIEERVNKLQREQERQLIEQGGSKGKKLIAIVREIEGRQRDQYEIREALEIAGEASEVLKGMIKYLQRARNWGNWDLVAGKQMTTLIKHSSIDQARNLAHRARHLLLKFEDELEDIYSHTDQLDLDLNMDAFVRFTDIFFDNLISDWIVQQRIRNALSSVRSVLDRVKRQVSTLEARRHSVNRRIAELRKERRRIAVS